MLSRGIVIVRGAGRDRVFLPKRARWGFNFTIRAAPAIDANRLPYVDWGEV